MGDVAQILAGSIPKVSPPQQPQTQTSQSTRVRWPGPPPANHVVPKVLHQNSSSSSSNTVLSREVLNVLGGGNIKASAGGTAASSTSFSSRPSASDYNSTALPPIVPSVPFTAPVHDTKGSGNESAAPLSALEQAPTVLKINNRYINSSKPARPWTWSSFTSSARASDGLTLHHWVRAGVEYPDYPYARFDVHLDGIDYYTEEGESSGGGVGGAIVGKVGSDEDKGGNTNNNGSDSDAVSSAARTEAYKALNLESPTWTQSETDTLLRLCRTYELRWPVIIDRWIGLFGSENVKKVEDLQHRYYTIGTILKQREVEMAARAEAESLEKVLNTMDATGGGRAGVPGLGPNASASASASGSSGEQGTSRDEIAIRHALASDIVSASATSGADASSATINAKSSIYSNTAATDVPKKGLKKDTNNNTTKLNIINSIQQPPISSLNTGTSNQPIFDLETERQRRLIAEMLWSRSKEEEEEEEELRRELKLVETQIRKLKKSGGHILAASAANAGAGGGTGTEGFPASVTNAANVAASSSLTMANLATTAAGGTTQQHPHQQPHPFQQHHQQQQQQQQQLTPASSRGPSPVPPGSDEQLQIDTATSYAMLEAQFASTAPTPTPGTPYLQSGRLTQPATGGHLGINKTTLKRMDSVLKELKVMERPIPTKRVCDLYDHVRKGVLTLLTLQKVMLKREGEVKNRRLKLEKLIGSAKARDAVANMTIAGSTGVGAGTVGSVVATGAGMVGGVGIGGVGGGAGVAGSKIPGGVGRVGTGSIISPSAPRSGGGGSNKSSGGGVGSSKVGKGSGSGGGGGSGGGQKSKSKKSNSKSAGDVTAGLSSSKKNNKRKSSSKKAAAAAASPPSVASLASSKAAPGNIATVLGAGVGPMPVAAVTATSGVTPAPGTVTGVPSGIIAAPVEGLSNIGGGAGPAASPAVGSAVLSSNATPITSVKANIIPSVKGAGADGVDLDGKPNKKRARKN